jgi:hypothetical protein
MNMEKIPDFLVQMAKPSVPFASVPDLEAVMFYVIKEMKPGTWPEMLQLCRSILMPEDGLPVEQTLP